MECPHLEESVRLAAPSMLYENPPFQWCCTVCKTNKNPWICLNCGVINCGRYVNGHAKEHFEDNRRLLRQLQQSKAAQELQDKEQQQQQQQEENRGSSSTQEQQQLQQNVQQQQQEVAVAQSLPLQELQEQQVVLPSIPPEHHLSPSSSSSSSAQPPPPPETLTLSTTPPVQQQQQQQQQTQLVSPPPPTQPSPPLQTSQPVQGTDVEHQAIAGPSPQTLGPSQDPQPPSHAAEHSIAPPSTVESQPAQKDMKPLEMAVSQAPLPPQTVESAAQVVALPQKSPPSSPPPLHHCVCMDCDSLATFCYTCDEFVINDTASGNVAKIRKQIEKLANAQRNHVKENQEKRKTRRRTSAETPGGTKKRLKTEEGGKPLRPRSSGLRNLGNTCFMNAVLQSLSNIHHFCGYIKQLPSLENKAKAKKVYHTRRCKDGDDILLVEELRKTLVALWQGTKSAISPESLFSVIWEVVPRFRGYQQQDAHEFMRYLLDRLHSELLNILPYPNSNSPYIGPKNRSTIVTAIFGGILQNEVSCLICGLESKKHDPFLDLSLDIPAHFASKSSKGENRCHLSDCLSYFTDVEELEESELYMCSNCKCKQRSTKKFWIRRLPNVLCLHLKRFRWNTYFRIKLETYIEFPVRGLDMNRFVLNNMHETRGSCLGSNEYDLAAVIVHHGSGAGSGHYTAYAIYDGRWYHFNDSTVTACEEETVAKCKAYILFYVRREVRLPDYLTVKPELS